MPRLDRIKTPAIASGRRKCNYTLFDASCNHGLARGRSGQMGKIASAGLAFQRIKAGARLNAGRIASGASVEWVLQTRLYCKPTLYIACLASFIKYSRYLWCVQNLHRLRMKRVPEIFEISGNAGKIFLDQQFSREKFRSCMAAPEKFSRHTGAIFQNLRLLSTARH